jgi:predicted RND superfamily exporter protein
VVAALAGFLAALFSFFQFLFHFTGALGIGVAAAAAVHCLWNLATALAGPRKGKKER